jgi:hypothetical protein
VTQRGEPLTQSELIKLLIGQHERHHKKFTDFQDYAGWFIFAF